MSLGDPGDPREPSGSRDPRGPGDPGGPRSPRDPRSDVERGRFHPSGLPRILATGGQGQLGVALSGVADTPGRDELDITAPTSIAAALDRYAPEVVINAAAYTDVDGAESNEVAARAINTDGVESLAVACRERGIRLIHISTDYVFSGKVPGGGDPATAPELEPDDPTEPTTAYGRTKLAGERAALAAYPEATIIRTAWLYTGAWRVVLGQPGSDFVATMIRLESQRETLNVVNDQWGSPTYVGTFADRLLTLLSAEKAGKVDARGRTLHLAGAGRATWCDLAREVFTLLGANPDRVRPCTSEEFPRPAPRPAFSVLGGAAWRDLGLEPPGDWRGDLAPGILELVCARDRRRREQT